MFDKNKPTEPQPVRGEKITEKDILLMYEEILPLLHDNPNNIDLPFQLQKIICERHIHFHFFHYFIQDPSPSLTYGTTHANFFRWINKGEQAISTDNLKDFSHIDITSTEIIDEEAAFKKLIDSNYQDMVNRIYDRYHEGQKFYYHRMESIAQPRVMVGFFRVKKDDNRPFSDSELQLFETLRPHIFLILRTVSIPVFQSQTFKYVDANVTICSKIAKEFHLTKAESRLLPEILIGQTNEEIGQKLFVAVPTVKKHLNNIFTKTGTKNRVDFIGKFFTSPERINL